MQKKHFIIIILSVIIAVFVILLFLYNSTDLNTTLSQNYIKGYLRKDTVITIGKNNLSVEFAKTPQEISKGLSGKNILAENEGMLFIFPVKIYPEFWMIDMNFDLDIIWISDNKIVYIHESVPAPSPGQNPKELPLYRPTEPVNYVLEVNAGYAKKNNVNVGDNVIINL
jgi:hypothetical protein